MDSSDSEEDKPQVVHQSSSQRRESSDSESKNSDKPRKRKRRLDAESSQSSESEQESENEVDKDLRDDTNHKMPTSGLLTKAQVQEQTQLEREKQAKNLEKVNKQHQ